MQRGESISCDLYRISYQQYNKFFQSQNIDFVSGIFTKIFRNISKVRTSRISFGHVLDLVLFNIGILTWRS